MRTKKYSLAVVVLSIFWSSMVWSEQTVTEDFSQLTLKELVALDVFTSASLLPTQIAKAPGTVHRFDRDDFKRFGVRRLDDLLAFVPGIQLNQYRKRHRSIWGRGLVDRYNDKIILMVDGVRIRHLYYGHFSLGEEYPLENIEQVEVILGPASSLYGANAFGGIISITTRAFSEKTTVELTAEVGSGQRQKVTGLYNSEHVQSFVSYHEQQAPFSEQRKTFIGGESLQPLDEQYQNIQLKLRPLEGLNLSASYRQSDTPFLFIPSSQNAFVEQNYLNVAASYVWGDIEQGRIETTTYYQNDKSREYEVEQLSQSLAYEEFQNATMAGLSVTGLRQIAQHTFALGLSWQHEQAEKTNYRRLFRYDQGFFTSPKQGDLLAEPNINNDDYALFLQDVWLVDPSLEITVGARYDQFERFCEHFNYRAAAVYSIDERQTLKAQYATAIRTPTFREYLKVLEGTTFQAPELDAEEIAAMELAYRYEWDNATVDITLYHNTVDNYISEMPTPDLQDEYFANHNTPVRLDGIESVLSMKPTDDFNLRWTMAYQQSDLAGQSIPYLYDMSVSLQLDYTIHASHIVGFTIAYNNTRRDSNSYSEDDADAFYQLNLFFMGDLLPDVKYSLGVENILNEKTFDPAADFGTQYNNQRSGRELWLRLSWDLAS